MLTVSTEAGTAKTVRGMYANALSLPWKCMAQQVNKV